MANAHTPQTGETQREKILQFVRAHPECTTREIQGSCHLVISRIGMYLARLQSAGLVNSQKTKGQRLLRWTAVPDEDEAEPLPARVVTTTWEPVKIAPQGIFAALGI